MGCLFGLLSLRVEMPGGIKRSSFWLKNLMKWRYRKETDGIIGLCDIVILVYYRKGFRKKRQLLLKP